MKSGKFQPERVALEQAFHDNATLHALLQREYQLLSTAAAQDDELKPEAARKVLQEWSSIYAERHALLQSLGGELRVHADIVLT